MCIYSDKSVFRLSSYGHDFTQLRFPCDERSDRRGRVSFHQTMLYDLLIRFYLSRSFRFFFLAIYTIEMCIKIIAKGFVINKYTYLRNPWNWLDFVVITSGYATIGLEVGNLAGLRTFRVLRALKTVSIMPGLKTIINALLHSFKQLAEVMTLTIFCLMVFALFALQVSQNYLKSVHITVK